MPTKIEWTIDVSPSIHSIIKDIENVDNAINDELVNDSMWNVVFKKYPHLFKSVLKKENQHGGHYHQNMLNGK